MKTTTTIRDLFKQAPPASISHKHPRFAERAPLIYSYIGSVKDRETLCGVAAEILADPREEHARFPVSFLERLDAMRTAAATDPGERERLTKLSIVVGRTPDHLHQLRQRVVERLRLAAAGVGR